MKTKTILNQMSKTLYNKKFSALGNRELKDLSLKMNIQYSKI